MAFQRNCRKKNSKKNLEEFLKEFTKEFRKKAGEFSKLPRESSEYFLKEFSNHFWKIFRKDMLNYFPQKLPQSSERKDHRKMYGVKENM